jgi:hypothetical protein
MKAGGLLRLLLLDGLPLVHEVNRHRKLLLVFRVVDPLAVIGTDEFLEVAREAEIVLLPGVNLWPGPPGRRAEVDAVELSLDPFLGFTIGLIEGVPLTVKETIGFASHVGGGVHAGPAKNDGEEILSTFDSMVPVNPGDAIPEFAPVAQTVLGIAAVVVEALMDLTIEVKLDPMSE